ncbi:MAG: BrnT family toxin [Alphaproteobacteria bacterium]
MKIEFDPAKSEKNARERGLPFDLVEEFDFDSALIVEDARKHYGELRYRAIGRMNEVVAVMVFTMREEAVRVISLRLANRKERLKYEKTQSSPG